MVAVFVIHRLLLCQVGRTQTPHRVGAGSSVLPSKYVLFARVACLPFSQFYLSIVYRSYLAMCLVCQDVPKILQSGAKSIYPADKNPFLSEDRTKSLCVFGAREEWTLELIVARSLSLE